MRQFSNIAANQIIPKDWEGGRRGRKEGGGEGGEGEPSKVELARGEPGCYLDVVSKLLW